MDKTKAETTKGSPAQLMNQLNTEFPTFNDSISDSEIRRIENEIPLNQQNVTLDSRCFA